MAFKLKEDRVRYAAEWAENNKDKTKLAKEKFMAANPGYNAFRNAWYIEKYAGRLPKWAELEKIKEFYNWAARLGMSVDHEIPRQGKNVCGLHVLANLRMIPLSDNLKKRNKFDD